MVEVKKDRILVISVDRDNDLGEKTGIKGPVIGKEKVVEAATEMGMKDPSDSDFNAFFEAVRIHEELKKQYATNVAIITGDKNVGIKSDTEINDQLDKALSAFRANFVVLVSDGSEDEHIMPIIQSKIPILSVRRLVVKQSEQLESTYFKIKDFMKDSLEDPKMAKLVFGLPAIVLLLISIFGAEGWRAVLGVFGSYLVIKAFRLETYFGGAADELRDSFNRRRLSFFIYMIGIILAAIAGFRGYTEMQEWYVLGLFETTAAFLSASVYYFWAAGAMTWLGKIVSMKKRTITRAISIPMFSFAIAIVIHSGVEMILIPETSLYKFLASIIAGFILLFGAVYMEKK